ncbi:MAG TPA: TetR/AcrR family transcriptional regulator [Kofleriaceae bacterium]|nr:TetR/AcrR family transcriptional regulator [Kofleriaceae bacterium]
MRADDRQRQILACAKRVFARRGFHAANISHICAEAGIGRGTLYQYFENKKAVFTAIIRQVLDRVQALVGMATDPLPVPEVVPRPVVVRFAAAQLRRVFEAVFEDEPTLRILLREAVGLDVDVERLLGEIDDALIGVVAADLRASQAAGYVRADLDPRMTATLMVGGVEKLALTALRGEEPVDLDRLATETARLHLVGTLSPRVPD